MKKVILVLLFLVLASTTSFSRDISNEQKIAGLYVAFFNRAPDLSGLNYWKGKTDIAEAQGKSAVDVFKEISRGFATHPVFTSIYSGLNNEEFVRAIYVNTLGGEGDEEGISYWTTQLSNNLSRSDMVAIFINSALTLDLTPENFPTLSQDALDAAKTRQDLITYKTQVAVDFVNQLGDKTNLDPSTNPSDVASLDADLAYKASLKILSGITADFSTVDEAKGYLESIAGDSEAIDEILDSFTPLNTISSCILNVTYKDGSGIFGACIENYPQDKCSLMTSEDVDTSNFSFMEKGDCSSLYFPLTPEYETVDSTTGIAYKYYIQAGAFISKNSEPTYINWENNSTTVDSTVFLPQNSPLSMSNVKIDVLFSSYVPDTDGKADIKFPKDKITDAYIMIQNPANSEYMIYLMSTLLPGETTTTFSAEDTAVSLVLNGIDHKYLIQGGTPQEVKDAIKQNSTAFIENFVQNLQNDPYYMRLENLTNIYTSSSFTQALADSKAVLKQMYDENQILYAQKQITSDGLKILPQEEINDFKILADRQTSYNFFSGDMTGNLVIQNDNMIPARYKVTDIFKKTPIHIPNTGLFGDLISPQSSLVYGYNASETQVKVNFRPTKITIYTPGWAYLSSDTPDYNYIKNMNFVLNERVVLDNVIMTILTMLPVGDEQVYLELAQWITSQGYFRTAIDEYYASKGQGSLINVIKNIVKGLMTWDSLETIIKKVSIHYSKDPVALAEQQAKWAAKLARAGVGTWIYAADLASLEADLMKTPAYIDFTEITFPTFLKYYDPSYPFRLKKVATTDETRKVTLTGDGLYEDGASPTVKLAALDKYGKYQPYTLSGSDIHKDSGSVWFDIPYTWLKTDSDIVGPIYFQYATSFKDSYTGNMIDVKVPYSFRDEYYKVFLDYKLNITSLSKDRITRGENLTIYGDGFSTTNEDNQIIFTSDGQTKTVTPTYSYGSYLETKIPDDLPYGMAFVKVKVKDTYDSNVKDFTVIPEIVTAEPKNPNNGTNVVDFQNPVDVTLLQSEGVEIRYSIGTSDKTNSLVYSSPIHVDKTTNIYTFARAYDSFHVSYDSDVMKYTFYKCADDEEFKDGECVEKEEESVVKIQLMYFEYNTQDSAPTIESSVNLNVPLTITVSGKVSFDFTTGYDDDSVHHTYHIWGTGTWDGDRLILNGTYTAEIRDTDVDDSAYFGPFGDCYASQSDLVTFSVNTTGSWDESLPVTHGSTSVTRQCEVGGSTDVISNNNQTPVLDIHIYGYLKK